MVGPMVGQLMSADPQAEGGNARNVYKVGLNTSRLLIALGDVVCSWLLLRQAEVALERLGRRRPARTSRSTRARSRPRRSSPAPSCRSCPPSGPSPRPTDLSVMDLDEAAF